MSKEWELERSELEYVPMVGLYNEIRFKELNQQLDQICDKFKGEEIVKTFIRNVSEEVFNIVQYNKKWKYLKVRTEFHPNGNTIKVELIYDDLDYYDPDKFNIQNVIGSIELYKSYERKYENTEKETKIYINFKLKELV